HSLIAVFKKSIRVHSFKLASNGITVKCDDADFGTYDIVDGKKYTKRKAGAITPDNAASTCTSGITDMSDLFKDEADFNGDISSSDVSNATNMHSMFNSARWFNQDIGMWNVSSVTDMAYMFERTPFNQDLNSWEVSNVTTMRDMFYRASDFNGNISSWDV